MSIRNSHAAQLLLSVAFIGVAVMLGRAATPAESAVTVSNKLAALAKAGEPITLDQLNRSYVQPPVGQNAAELYAKAFAVLPTNEPTSATLAKYQSALDLLLQAAGEKSYRYPIDLKKGFSLGLPHLVQIRRSARLLSVAASNQVLKAQPEAALKTIEAGIALARSLENEPVIISRLVAWSALTIDLMPVEDALERGAFNGTQLARLQTALQGADSLSSFHNVLSGERASLIALFQMPPAGLSELMGASAVTNFNPEKIEQYKKTPTFQEDFNYALDHFNFLMEKERAGFPFKDAEPAKPIDPGFLFSRIFLPATEATFIRAATTEATLRMFQTAVAIERYSLAHANTLPAGLDQLTPQFLPKAPRDPFDGQPIRYKKLARGYMLYSVGKDKMDNGGKIADKTKPDAGADLPLSIVRQTVR